jgi:hypothetical protein
MPTAQNNSIETTIAVRVIAKGGKFLGADIGGATVTIHNAVTNELLASGVTSGGSGDIWQIMIEARTRTQSIPTDGASVFMAQITSPNCQPIPLHISATGPGAGLQSSATTSTTQWVVPGVTDAGGNPVVYDCLLELPGLIVQVLEPATHLNITQLPQVIAFSANVAMMCGCPIDNNTNTDGTHTFANPWPVNDFKVGAQIVLNNKVADTITLDFDAANSPGRFTGKWAMTQPGFYTATVYAYQLSTGNTGTAVVSFFMIAPAG